MAKIIISHVPISTVRCLLKVVEAENALYVYDPRTLGDLVAHGIKTFGPTCEISELSGEPGYRYRTGEVNLNLTTKEICRLTAHRLSPTEYLKLRDAHGIFFEIHDDFYNDDGKAIMPHAMAF